MARSSAFAGSRSVARCGGTSGRAGTVVQGRLASTTPPKEPQASKFRTQRRRSHAACKHTCVAPRSHQLLVEIDVVAATLAVLERDVATRREKCKHRVPNNAPEDPAPAAAAPSGGHHSRSQCGGGGRPSSAHANLCTFLTPEHHPLVRIGMADWRDEPAAKELTPFARAGGSAVNRPWPSACGAALLRFTDARWSLVPHVPLVQCTS